MLQILEYLQVDQKLVREKILLRKKKFSLSLPPSLPLPLARSLARSLARPLPLSLTHTHKREQTKKGFLIREYTLKKNAKVYAKILL